MPAPPRLRFKRAEPRLDPVRWRRPGRGMLLRMVAVAALLIVGAAAAWSRQPACTPPTAAAGAPSIRAEPTASSMRTRAGSPAGPMATTTGTEHPAGGAQRVPPGRVGVPVRLAESTALTLVHPGDRVDLLRVDGAGRGTSAVATAAPVLDITGGDDPMTGGLLLALRPEEAQTAVAAQGRGFAVLVRPE